MAGKSKKAGGAGASAARALSANLQLGQVAFEALGEHWILSLDFNALCALEQRLQLAPGDFGALMRGPMAIRTTFMVGLQEAQPKIDERQVGRIITAIGFQRAEQLVDTALQWALPPAPTEAEVASGDAGPPIPAAAGT